MIINLGIGRVQNPTARNVFLKDKSLYEFISSVEGQAYENIKYKCDTFYGKDNTGKYFGQIITPINLLGLIQTQGGNLVKNKLLDRIYYSGNEMFAKYYMNYFLCMWQYPLPSTQKNSGRNFRRFKPYCLLLKILLTLYEIDEKEAYLTSNDFETIFMSETEHLPLLSEIDQEYAENVIRRRIERKSKGYALENGSLTYIKSTLSESDILSTDKDDFPNAEKFYVGFKYSQTRKILADFVIRAYGNVYFDFDAQEAAGKRETMSKYCCYLNNVGRFKIWRSSYVNISRIAEFIDYCVDRGFYYSDDLIRRFIMSLETKPFLLLTGISGSGKTKIAELWMQFLKEKGAADGIQIAVGSNWTDNKKLLGFNNVLLEESEAFQTTRLIELLREANKPENALKEYIVIMDEMNLSRVEMYFADFLSALESISHEIFLANGEILKWSENIKIIGTVNVDESTYMFSPKVLDRANVIEMNGVKPTEYIKSVMDSDDKIYKSVCGAEWFDDYQNLMDDIYLDLNGDFSYRVIDEITTYIALNVNMYGDENIMVFIDEQISQKILPKLHGSRAQLKPKLDRLQGTFADKAECKLINKKLEKMQEDLKKGYASFIGD